ncbi:Rhophilin-2-B [Armadillidium vulgare]|nr:Rhophilin-2-B [Armadillidium vulgare]
MGHMGSDPRLQTCRGKLQNRRSKLNMEINKELMLRSGAENLYQATSNKKLRDMVALELQFFNSNLQLLKEQLGELNSSVEIYQGNRLDFILEHYSEEPSDYEEVITEFMELREAMRTPERDECGVSLLFEYFNQLYFIDRRFFPPDRSLGIYFEWYDSLTGTPSCQRTVAFEKACVLFNIGALYTQIGARHDRSSSTGLDAAVNCFLRAAGVFRFLVETFTNAPSKDLSPEVLEMLIQMMLAQARECLFEKMLLNLKESVEQMLELSQEASRVSKEYEMVFTKISDNTVKGYVPPSWITLVHVKVEHYKGRAHFLVAEALLPSLPENEGEERIPENELSLSHRAREILMFLHLPITSNTTIKVTVPTTRKERTLLGLSHGCEAAQSHEEALRILRMCRELRKKNGLNDLLSHAHDDTLHLLEVFQDEDMFQTVLDPPPIAPSTKVQLSLSTPDFSQHRAEDIFRRLGPMAVFNAKHQWSAPRPAKLIRSPSQGFGFAVKGDAPVIIAGVDRNSLAERAGIHEGDILVSISGKDVKWLPHEDVVTLIREAGNSLNLGLVTPCDKTFYKLPKSKSLKDLSPHSTTSSSSGVSTSSNRSSSASRCSNYGSINSSTLSSHKEKRLSWNPFKKSLSRDRLKAESLNDCNIILR